MKEKEASIPKRTSDFGCQHSRSTTYDEINWDPNRQVVIWSDSLRPEHANHQTNEMFHEELMISRSPEEEEPSHEEITKEIASPLRIHLIYHQNMMNCQVTQTCRSPKKIQNL